MLFMLDWFILTRLQIFGDTAMSTCPVCKFSAKEIEKDFFYGKTYLCPRHGEFDVTLQVLESPTHMHAGPNDWEVALRRASEKATNRSRPVIRLFDFYDWAPGHILVHSGTSNRPNPL